MMKNIALLGAMSRVAAPAARATHAQKNAGLTAATANFQFRGYS